MRKYHLSCGDSTRGGIGLCGSVRARNRKEALRALQRALGSAVGQCSEIPIRHAGGQVEYLNVYLSPENINLADVELDC